MSAIAPNLMIYPLPLSKIARILGVDSRTLGKYAQGLCLEDSTAIRDRHELERLIRAFVFCKRGARGGRGGTRYTPWEYAAIEVDCTDQETQEVIIEALDAYLVGQHKIHQQEIIENVKRVCERIGERVDRAANDCNLQDSGQGFSTANWQSWPIQ